MNELQQKAITVRVLNKRLYSAKAGIARLSTKTRPLQLAHSNRQWMRAKDALTQDLARAYNMTMVPRRCIQAELTLLGTHSSLLTG